MAKNTKPLSEATRKKRSESGYSVNEGNIAAIDFGTTYCSLAYKTKGDRRPITVMHIEHKERVPNSILIQENNDGTHTAVAFGFTAAKEFLKYSKRCHYQDEYIYFEQLKMLLERDEVSKNVKEIYIIFSFTAHTS